MHDLGTIPFAFYFEDKRNVIRMHRISLLTCETLRKILGISYPVTAAVDLHKNTHAFTPLMGTEIDSINMIILDLDKSPKVLPILSKSNVDSRFSEWFGLLQKVNEMGGGGVLSVKYNSRCLTTQTRNQLSLFFSTPPPPSRYIYIYFASVPTLSLSLVPTLTQAFSASYWIYLSITNALSRSHSPSHSHLITLSCSHSL